MRRDHDADNRWRARLAPFDSDFVGAGGGLLVLNWLFPLIETRAAEDMSGQRGVLGRALLPHPRVVPGRATNAQQQRPTLKASQLKRHWRAHLRLIAGLLLVWFGVWVLPTFFAPSLNQLTFAGFPLGYVFVAQVALIMFVAVIVSHSWAAERIDRRFGSVAPTDPPQPHLSRWVVALTVGLGGLLLLLERLEAFASLPKAAIGWLLMLMTLGMYAIVGLRTRAHSVAEYYVADRRVPPLFNGLAIGADWMSAATFLGLAGFLWRFGYEGLAYVLGWTGGYVLLALLIAPYIRRFGQYTVPDFIGARYGSAARIVAAILAILISFTYLTAQVTGLGIIMGQLLRVPYFLGVLIGLSTVLFCSFVGGMQAITWTQVAQCIILIIAYLVPVTWLAYRVTGVPLPQLMYGHALQDITALEANAGIRSAYVEPFNDWTRANFLALTLCLMMGTAGLPHLIVRCLTTSSVRATRRSVGWAVVFIVVIYSAIPAYAAFARREILVEVIGKPLTSLPAWTVAWERNGQIRIVDDDQDRIVGVDEFHVQTNDVIVLATPDIAGMPQTIAALVAVGGVAAALSTADGLLLVIASAVAHDLYFRTFSPRAGSRKRLLIGRAMVFTAALAAALTATRQLGIIVQLVAWAFSLAAATIFPVLVLGIFWKRANGKGAVAGMLTGLVVTLSYMIATVIDPQLAVLGISDDAAGIFGMPVAVFTIWLVSSLTTAPSVHVRDLVDLVRSPEGAAQSR